MGHDPPTHLSLIFPATGGKKGRKKEYLYYIILRNGITYNSYNISCFLSLEVSTSLGFCQQSGLLDAAVGLPEGSPVFEGQLEKFKESLKQNCDLH